MIKFFKSFFQAKKIEVSQYAPPFIHNYVNKINSTQNIDNQLIKKTRFVVFDTETTGLDVQKDKLLSIGAVSVLENSIAVEESFELFIQQDDIVGDEAIGVHGILKKGKKVKIFETDAVAQFIDFCGDSILVGHHVGFDVAMINKHLETHYGLKLQNTLIDTVTLHQRVIFLENYNQYQIPENLTLDALAKSFHIETTDRHRALGDAYITAILFIKLLQQLKKRNVLLLKDLLRNRWF